MRRPAMRVKHHAMTNSTKLNRGVTVGYGALSYLVFVVAFLYAIGFVGDIGLPRSVDHAIPAPIGQAAVVNALLLGLFAIQHSVMARPAFKRWWTRLVPQQVERSTYVLIASLVLLLLYWQWRSVPAEIWDVRIPVVRQGLWASFWAGWVTVLATTFMLNHFELFGLRQVYLAWRGKPHSDTGFRTPLLYRIVRHPLMLGFIVAFWATPTMTAGHLMFAAATTGYILIALQFEERDLVAALGAQYRSYRREVPMLLPRPHRRATNGAGRIADSLAGGSGAQPSTASDPAGHPARSGPRR
jgi:protein-S-isoprenylcysteine O-methyltransferase Ste14